MLFILFYCVKSLNRSTDARCFVKGVGKIDKVIFCGAKYIKNSSTNVDALRNLNYIKFNKK